MVTEDAVRQALATVNDPEIHRPITDLGMVKSVEVGTDGAVAVTVYLTISGCPMRETITQGVTDAVSAVLGLLLQHRAVPASSAVQGATTVLGGELPSVEVDAVRTALPTAAHGFAVLESWFDHHAPLRGDR